MHAQPAQIPETHRSLFLLRVGLHGQVGRFFSAEPIELTHGYRTVCRTARGLELGIVLRCIDEAKVGRELSDGRILRRMTAEDELLWGHLQQLGEETHQACAKWLAQTRSTATLLEVEPLLDGRTLYFHFLSEVDQHIQVRLDELVAIYEQRVQESKFAKLLQQGCGPGCGTSQAKNGCGSRGGCAVCKVAKACGSKSP